MKFVKYEERQVTAYEVVTVKKQVRLIRTPYGYEPVENAVMSWMVVAVNLALAYSLLRGFLK